MINEASNFRRASSNASGSDDVIFTMFTLQVTLLQLCCSRNRVHRFSFLKTINEVCRLSRIALDASKPPYWSEHLRH